MDIVIGIGNELRGDDGVGPYVVEAIPVCSGLETMTVHQLVPELAERIQAAQRVLFIDACVDCDEVRLARVKPSDHRGLAHAVSPSSLLHWTQRLFEVTPEAWLLSIPGYSFGLGEPIGPETRKHLSEAQGRLDAWLTRDSLPCVVDGD